MGARAGNGTGNGAGCTWTLRFKASISSNLMSQILLLCPLMLKEALQIIGAVSLLAEVIHVDRTGALKSLAQPRIARLTVAIRMMNRKPLLQG